MGMRTYLPTCEDLWLCVLETYLPTCEELWLCVLEAYLPTLTPQTVGNV